MAKFKFYDGSSWIEVGGGMDELELFWYIRQAKLMAMMHTDYIIRKLKNDNNLV